MTRSLLDAWNPEPHEVAISAAAWDRSSGLRATADLSGLVSVSGDDFNAPARTWQHAAVQSALALSPGGALVAVGDDAGALAVYRTADGEAVFLDTREDGSGPTRAMRGLSFSPEGDRLAALAIDGRMRIVNLRSRERVATFPDFTGHTIGWDASGARLVAVDHLRQPVLVELIGRKRIALPVVPGGAQLARFVPGADRVVVLGPTGLYLVDLAANAIVAQRVADRSSGMLDLVFSPDADRFAVITARSVHLFAVDGVRYLESLRHGAPEATGVAIWDDVGVAVAGSDARLHRPDAESAPPPSVCVVAIGKWRACGHEHVVAMWQENHRRRTFIPQVLMPGGDRMPAPMAPGGRVIELRLDRDGGILALLPEHGPLHVYSADTGRLLFQAGDDTIDTPRFDVAVGVVGCLLPQGGLRWTDLTTNQTFNLPWVRDFDLSGGGTWLAVLTPKGRVRILDPKTGALALPELALIGDAPIRQLAFGEALPNLLVLDADGMLGLYDLPPAARDGLPAVVYPIAQFHDANVDQIWGLSDGKRAAVRILEADGTATIAYVDLDTGELASEVRGLIPYASLDPVSGAVVEPARGAAMLERDPYGRETRVMRSLPNGEWITYSASGIAAASGGAKRLLAGRRPTT